MPHPPPQPPPDPDPILPPPAMPAHMSADDFRRRGRQVIDRIADYLESLESRPVLAPTRPGDVLAALPDTAPDNPQSFDTVLSDLDQLILPALTHWQSPNFFAFFPANGSYPAILGDLLSTGLGVQGMLWATSPACTELEMRVLDWLARAIGLPESFCHQPLAHPHSSPALPADAATPRGSGSLAGAGGVIHSTASEGTLVALVAARDRARTRHRAQATSRPFHPVIYASTQAHSSVVKAAMIAGLATDPDDRTHLRLIETDAELAMLPSALETAIAADVSHERTPAFICGTLGTTGTAAVDPLHDVGLIARRAGAWLHVDAAFLGSQFICPEHRAPLLGVEHADSFCFNPHKWLLTAFDCSCFWTRDAHALTRALSVTPEYLRNAASSSGAVVDYRDWQIPLGRRFRALKLWLVIRHYGLQGLRAHIREHLRIAAIFEALVRQDPRFELTATRTSALVCFRLRPTLTIPDEPPQHTDARNRSLLERVNATGRAYLTHTVIPPVPPHLDHPRLTLRLAIGASRTQEHHVRAVWDLISQCAGAVS